MLPRLAPDVTLEKVYSEFLTKLRLTIFGGEICCDFATRLSVATDNSIYQVTPQAVIFPRTTEDIATLLQLAQQKKFRHIKFCARGGGTSTNGQSLTAGIIIDCSRYMRAILEINVEASWVRVQPGVVLDQLNATLKPLGVSFAPEISPSNRATIGGMVNTDACGTGSRILGRTSDHVLDLLCVLQGGKVAYSSQLDANDALYSKVRAIISPHLALIQEKFAAAPRTLNGYNLQKAYANNLTPLICGSEGTLAIVSECKLKLTPIPKYKKLLVVKYRSFDDALRAHELTEEIKPLSIEAIDEKLINLARNDILYFSIKNFIDTDGNTETGAVNIVEFVANDETELANHVAHFCDVIDTHKHQPHRALGYYVAKNATEIKLLWDLRKKSVGLISKEKDGSRRPIPFIEDTAVPPEKLADYISELKTILDSYQLHYGMYGHVDAGCVHVRPALDMKLTQDEHLLRELMEKVVTLIQKYSGVLWGEHGQGHRSEYAERFFGETLYSVVRQIKTVFDPYNQLNPGKIATAIDSDQALVSLNGPLRGHQDKQISDVMRVEFPNALICNGNGACFNYASAEVMCPSYKVTKDRVHSPKGRATLMREWLRELANKKFTLNVMKKSNLIAKLLNSIHKRPDFSHEVYAAMSGCLSCKACATQCPLNVDVPEFKSKFLAIYYQRYLRPIRDYLVAYIDSIAPLQAKMPRLTNGLLRLPGMSFIFQKLFNLVNIPTLSPLSLKRALSQREATPLHFSSLKKLTTEQKKTCVILLQDTLTSFYETQLAIDIYDFLTLIGYTVIVAPFFANGKALHVKGFLRKYSALVKHNHVHLQELASLNIPLVGIDPSITLTYRDEYQKIIPHNDYKVHLLQEWLITHMPNSTLPAAGEYYLLSHCTEKTYCVESEKQWQTIFQNMGVKLTPLAVGCCGMAGSYGHEAEHVANSKELFKMDWQRYLTEYPKQVIATGYSCRSQAKRMLNVNLLHPIQVLLRLLT